METLLVVLLFTSIVLLAHCCRRAYPNPSRNASFNLQIAVVEGATDLLALLLVLGHNLRSDICGR